ncbi:MAG: sensor histidine kinase [Acidobacteria bacterium]|nr:sensor histidine kinase [Acidobacteriota bacterium]
MQARVVKPLALAVSIVAISVLHYATSPSQLVWHEIYQHLYYVPVIVGAYWYGVAGGLACAIATSLAYLPHIQWTWGHDLAYAADQYAEIGIFYVIGVTVGLLSSAQRRITAKYRETAVSLERSHKDLLASQEHLRRAERLSVLGQVAAGLAHEIRNPLAGLKGALEIIASRVPPNSPEAEFAGIAARDAARLDGLVTDFLTYARPRDPELQDVDLHTVIEHVVTVIRPEAERASVRVAVEPSGSPISVRVDREQMAQVFLNVVLNAVQASRFGGTVRIQERADSGWAIAEVSDEGPGIPPEYLARIFDPFFTTRQRGTGLGLAISQRIVQAHGGTIEVRSSSTAGSTFRVQLPLVNRPVASTSHSLAGGVV